MQGPSANDLEGGPLPTPAARVGGGTSRTRRSEGGGQRRHAAGAAGSKGIENADGDGDPTDLVPQLSLRSISSVRRIKMSATGDSQVEGEQEDSPMPTPTPIIVLDDREDTHQTISEGGNGRHHRHRQGEDVLGGEVGVSKTPQGGTTTQNRTTNTTNHQQRCFDLDLQHNDNSFHVLAELLVDFFQPHFRPGEESCFVFESAQIDRQTLQRLLPESSVQPFLAALRHRLQEQQPTDVSASSSSFLDTTTPALRQLVQKCHELRLDETAAEDNPILALLQHQMPQSKVDSATLTIPIVPRRRRLQQQEQQQPASAPARKPTKSGREQQHDGDNNHPTARTAANSEGSPAPPSPKQPQIEDMMVVRKALSSTAAAPATTPATTMIDIPRTASEPPDVFRAVLAGSFSSKSDTGKMNTSGTNHHHHHQHWQQHQPKQQQQMQQHQIIITEPQRLAMEIQEAKALMNASVEVETKHFWKAHLTSLQAQLKSFRPEPVVVDAEEAPPPIIFPIDRKPSDATHSRQRATTTTSGGGHGDHHPHQHSSSPPPPPPHRPMVDVVAPADLPAGYRFEAEIEGVRFIATVPSGGVQQGETFTCVMQELDSVAIDIPVGHWKDGSCDLCALGCCHPSAWHAIFCPLILLSQVQTRLDLDFLGRPRFGAAPITNRSLMFIVVTFWIVADAVLFTACNLKWSQGLELTAADWCAVAVVNVFLVGFVIFVTQATRGSLREKYMIREERCFDLEDLCCAVTCLPCSVAQMARHTANYHNYEAVCCSKTGLPDGVKVDRDLTAETTTTTGSDGGGGGPHRHNEPVHDGGSNRGYAV